MPITKARVHLEDMRTRHAALWGLQGSYLEDGKTVLAKLKKFFDNGIILE